MSYFLKQNWLVSKTSIRSLAFDDPCFQSIYFLSIEYGSFDYFYVQMNENFYKQMNYSDHLSTYYSYYLNNFVS